MKKAMVLLIAVSLILPALALAKEQTEWAVGGIIEKTKVYGSDEAHGYVFRIDVKRPNGDVKKFYLKKTTVIEDTNGQKIGVDALKVGKSVTVNYQKDGNNFVAYKITRGK